MPPKKRNRNTPKKPKKTAPKKNIKKKTAKKPVAPKKALKKKAKEKDIPVTTPPEIGITRGLKPCICIENNEGWFCMKRLPSGELKECDGPFDTKEECEMHFCN